MSRLALTALAVAAVLCGLAGPVRAGSDKVVIAVAYFDNNSGKSDLAAWRKGIADMLITDLAVSEELTVVERGRLQDILSEIKLQKSPYIDKKSAVRLGRGLGAAYIVTGSYAVSKRKLRIDVRVIDVESGAIVYTTKQTGKFDNFFDVQSKLAAKLLNGLGAKLTLIQKKRLGARNTKKRDAFDAYSKALDARDRGDKAGERAALRTALAADPSFAAVKKRLARLEKKVAVLEKSGGRIIRPTTARQFMHNARIEKAEGDYKGALNSLRRAAHIEPTLIDVWLLIAEVSPDGAPFTLGKIKLDRRRKALIKAFQRKDADALYAAVRKRGGANKVYAASFLFALIHGRLPAKSFRPFAMAYHASEQIISASKRGALAPLFVDHLKFLKQVRAVRARYFDSDGAAQIKQPGQVVIADRGGMHEPTNWWSVVAVTRERPKAGIEMIIERDTAHPHWREAAAPRGVHRINTYIIRRRSPKSKVLDLFDKPDGLVYSFDHWEKKVFERGPLPSATTIGKPLPIPAKQVRCRDDKASLTQTTCRVDLQIFKPGLPPGLYRVTLRYRDANGHQVSRAVPGWAMEFRLLPHHSINYPGPRRLVTFVHKRDAQRMAKKLLGKRAFAVDAMVMVQNYFRGGMKGGNKLAHYYYDIDYSLRGGKQPTGGHRSWMKYRDRIIKQGYKVAASGRGTQYLALPKLTDGKHFVCLVAERTNGSKTPEAECLQIDIQRSR